MAIAAADTAGRRADRIESLLLARLFVEPELDYLVFEDEGHDVLKLGNRVRCYETIVAFFSRHLS